HIAGFCAMCAIQNHVSRALQSTGRILAPKDLVMNLRCISRNFRNSRQEDAHEYMVNLLESMHKCSLPSGVPSQSSGAYEKSLVHKIFGGRLRSQVKCTQCNYCSNTFDPFLDLSLEINRADSLRRALQHFTATEQLDGGEKHYQCQRCKQKVRALKQLTVDKAPYVLSVHLKRFGSHVQGQKINKNVEFGPTLDLRPYYSGPHQGDLKYTLYGVLVHAGWSTRSGHYYCFVRTSTGMWHSLDDNTVRQVSEKVVLQQKAYMLFYVRDVKSLAPMKPNNAMRKENMMSSVVGTRDNLVLKAGLKENISNGPSMNQASLHQNKIQEMAKSSLSLKDPLRQVSNKDLPNGSSTSHSTGVNNVTNGLLGSALSGDKKIASPEDKIIVSTLEHKVANSVAEVVRESLSQGSDKNSGLSNAAPLNCNGLQKSSVTREVGVDGKLPTGNSGTRVSSLKTENVKLVAPSPQVGDKNNQDKGIVSETSSKDKLFTKQTEPALKVKENGSVELDCHLAMPNGCDPKKSVDSKNHQKNLKPKKKLMKSRPVSLHLGSKLMLKASLRKKKLKKKSRKTSEVDPSSIRSEKQKDNSSLGSWISDLKIEKVVKDCNGDSNIKKDGEVRERAFVNALVSLHVDSKPMLEASVKKKKLKKKSRKTSEVDLTSVLSGIQKDSSSLGSWVSGLKLEKIGKDCNGDFNITKDGEIRERAFVNSAVLATENSSKQTSNLTHEGTKCDAREPDSLHEKTNNESQQDLENMLTRGRSVDPWDKAAPRSSYAPRCKTEESIGYVLDDWDQEYDQGKRKKVREKKVFDGTNVFQQHASENGHPNKKARGMDKYSSASRPYRIPERKK
ncbi:hypothetical protein MKW92_029139, partial [Papaver armeniacum]